MKSTVDQSHIQHYIQKYYLEHIFQQPNRLPLQLRTYERSEVILREGAELDGIYFQVEGRTRVSSSVQTGKSLLLRFCHPLSVFGDVELIQKVVIQSQVEAVQRTTLLFINKHSVENVLMQEHNFLHELLRQLSYKLQTCTTASRVNLLVNDKVAK